MSELITIWQPDEWEEYCLGLLQDRHGPLNVEKIPARHKGDCGLDYYCRAEQVAYQCYAVEEPRDVASRVEAQKAKITEDIGKFCKNLKDLKKVFGSALICRWVLLVPLHDSKEANMHCTKKTEEVRKKKIPYATENFEIHIQDVDCFDHRSRSYRLVQRKTICLSFPVVVPGLIIEWSKRAPSLVLNLRRKLQKRMSEKNRTLDNDVEEAIGWFLAKENALESLRSVSPDLHETVEGIFRGRLSQLRLFGSPQDGDVRKILQDEFEGLVSRLRSQIPNISIESAEQLALGTISQWMMNCPLNFPPYEDEHE